ncbi:mating-type protein MAT alpha 1-domain-containing protein [Aspergillus lucknowensis]|uniref:Mating-type protein MAT alpha 1-domain-containing protein n=1 Tax=Aspergillus lucknowensis TaxID=176173 RepID=A0ABR4LNJ7_9EURO
MENTMSPLQRAFNAFLLSMPPQQLEGLVKYLQDVKAQENGHALFRHEDPATHSGIIPDANHSSTVLPGPNNRPASSRGRKIHDGKRRPLNSFIAFRSFYSVIFPDLTQKAKSGILRFLWQNDPFKAKWTILAKAYSIVRDEHDAEVTLESFLTLNAELIGILEPVRYLDAMGWELTDNGNQQYTMARIKSPVATEAELSTNCSVDDLIKHCYAAGYVTEDQRKKGIQARNTPAMAFATQPTLVIPRNNSLQITGNHTVVSTDGKGNVAMEPLSPEPTEANDSPYPSDIVTPMADDTAFEVTNSSRTYRGPQTNNAHAENYLDLTNMQLPDWDEQMAFLPYNTAPLMQEPFEAFDFNPYLNL